VSVIEPHGLYDISKEVTVGYKSNLKSLRKVVDNETMTVVELITQDGKTLLYAVINSPEATATQRQFLYKGINYSLKGNYLLQLITQK